MSDGFAMPKSAEQEPIFSGPYSEMMWDKINNSRTVPELRDALYRVCCKLQEFEARARRHAKRGRK